MIQLKYKENETEETTLNSDEIKNVVMDGFRGTVQKIEKLKYLVKVNGDEKVITLQKDDWNDGFEYAQHEIAFGLMLDYLTQKQKTF